MADVIAAPWSAFADGTACLAADGRGGECARGACLARSTCGDGVLDPSPDPDPDPNPYPNLDQGGGAPVGGTGKLDNNMWGCSP